MGASEPPPTGSTGSTESESPPPSAEPPSETSRPSYVRGFRADHLTGKALEEALEAAFDYRGDVTLVLAAGDEISGYLSNRDFAAPAPFVEMFPASGTSRRRIEIAGIRGVHFTGKDTAAGKSWQSWVKKYEAQRAARAACEAAEPRGLYPESLD